MKTTHLIQRLGLPLLLCSALGGFGQRTLATELGPIFPLQGGTQLATRPDGTTFIVETVNECVEPAHVLAREIRTGKIEFGATNQSPFQVMADVTFPGCRFPATNPDIAANSTNAVFAYVNKGAVIIGEPDEFSIEYFLVDANGNPASPVMLAGSSDAWSDDPTVRVAMNRAGQFAVAYWDQIFLPNDSTSYIRGRLFSADGQPIGTNSYFTVNQLSIVSEPVLALAEDGSSVYAWARVDYAGNPQLMSGSSIYAHRVDATGTPVGNEFRVNTSLNSYHSGSEIAIATNGSFVIIWNQSNSDADGVYLQRFDAAGNRLGTEVRASPYNGTVPQVAMSADGRFIVAWQGQDADGGGIFAQRFLADGSFYGRLLWVNEGATNSQTSPLLGIADDGTFIVKWQEGTNHFARWISWDATNSAPLLGPWIRRFAPTEPVSIPPLGFELEFDHPIQPGSFTVDDLQVIDPFGRIVQGATIITTNGLVFSIEMPERFLAGRYQVLIGTNIIDAIGFSLDQNANGIFGETTDGFSKTFLAAPHPGSFPLNEGFEGNEESIRSWSFDSTVTKTVSLINVAPHGGLRHLRFNTELLWDGMKQSATVRIDLSGQASQTNLNVAFWAKSYSSYWGVCYLSVLLSGDGNSWHSLASLLPPAAYTQFVFDLDQAATNFGISLDEDVYLRFEHEHQNSYGIGFTQWVDLDDVRIVAGNPNAPTLAFPSRTLSGQFQLQLTGPVGSNYVIQASADLTTWIPITTNVISAGGSLSITDPLAPNYPQRFYRAVSQ